MPPGDFPGAATNVEPRAFVLSFRAAPSILERSVLRESVLPFFLGFGMMTFLFVMDFLFDFLDLLIAKGVPAPAVAELFLLALGWITALSFPCGVLVAALMAFGRMAQDNEITAMRALGVHLGQILRAPLVAGLGLAGVLTLFNNFVLPETNHRYANLTAAIHRKQPAARIEPQVFIDDFDNYSLYVGEVDGRTGRLGDVMIQEYQQGKIPTTILAKRGHLQYEQGGAVLRLDLEDGEVHEVPGEAVDGKYRRLHFDTQTLYLENSGAVLQRDARRSRGEREMNVAMLRAEIGRFAVERDSRRERLEERVLAGGYDSYANYRERHAAPSQGFWAGLGRRLGLGSAAPADTTGGDRQLAEAVQLDLAEIDRIERRIDNLEVEVQKKFSIPFACVVFVLVGGPLGIRMRRGGFANMAVAAGFFVVYYLLLIGGEQLADRRIVSPFLAMWFPNLSLAVVGIYLSASVLALGPSRGMR